jgi:glyoxylase-like metal-dependent hydrolase (beta-lactamase superfamily II)/rhodanese-related sulfurtransferase
MHFKQFYVGCLAHASYLIGDGGEAAVVDPSRDVQMYLDEAKAHGLTIRWILETHLHADFVSGHRELAARTGATIGIGAGADAQYPHRALREGDDIALGGARLRVMETPGHTPESLSFVVFEREGDAAPWAVLTGDTLFVGDVGRVDILSSRLPVEELAGMMYDSLHGKLLKLPDATRVYPAHGAGSLCGRGIRAESWSTIGQERMMNAALADHGRAAFIAGATQDVPETPVYFLHSRDTNRLGPTLDAERPMPPAIAPADAAARVEQGAVLLDTRSPWAYAVAHPRGALHVGLDGQYASWVGTLVTPDTPLILIADRGREEEAVMRLARVGYERVEGLLEGGAEVWRAAGLPVARCESFQVSRGAPPDWRVLDVRRAPEWVSHHFEGAVHVPLGQLGEKLATLDRDAPWLVVCAGGYRSYIGASVLERAGFTRVAAGADGMDAALRARSALVGEAVGARS